MSLGFWVTGKHFRFCVKGVLHWFLRLSVYNKGGTRTLKFSRRRRVFLQGGRNVFEGVSGVWGFA